MLTDFRVAPSLTWNEAFALWLRQTPTRKARKRAELTLDAYLRDVQLFAKWFEKVNGQAFNPDLLNTTDVSDYFKMLEAEMKPATYNRKLASMRMLVNWAREMGMIDYDPLTWVPFNEVISDVPRDVAGDEWERLETAAESLTGLLGLRDRLIFWLMGLAGLRISEAIELKLSDLHLNEGYIRVMGKGRKVRKVRVKRGKLVDCITTWQAEKPESIDGTLVTDENGRAIGREAAWRRFVMIAETAGSDATPHCMRHTFIYRFLDECEKVGMKSAAAMKAACLQTGDTADVILKYYTGARDSDIYAAMERM